MVDRHNATLAACQRQPLFVPRDNADGQIVQTRDHNVETKGERSWVKDRRARKFDLPDAVTRRRRTRNQFRMPAIRRPSPRVSMPNRFHAPSVTSLPFSR